MTPTEDHQERCETCRYWLRDSSECRRRAPSLVVSSQLVGANGRDAQPGASAWPVTAASAWCGEWAPAHEPPKAAPAPAEPTGQDDSVATRLFLARVAPGLSARNPAALLESLLEQLPSDVRQVLVRTNGLDGRPPAGLKDVARECKMSQGHVRALIATGEELLTDVVRLLSRQRERL